MSDTYEADKAVIEDILDELTAFAKNRDPNDTEAETAYFREKCGCDPRAVVYAAILQYGHSGNGANGFLSGFVVATEFARRRQCES